MNVPCGRGIGLLVGEQEGALDEDYREGEDLGIVREDLNACVTNESEHWGHSLFSHFRATLAKFSNVLSWCVFKFCFQFFLDFTEAVADGGDGVVTQHHRHLQHMAVTGGAKGGGCCIAVIGVRILLTHHQLSHRLHGTGFEQGIDVVDDLALGSSRGVDLCLFLLVICAGVIASDIRR